MKVFVGCSSYDDIDKKYFDTAKKVSNILIDHNCTLVVGGGDYGLMGSVYHQFLDNDKPVLGIATDYYKCDLDKMDCKKIYVKSTLDQMAAFMKESDIFLFLPGGYGTYNEIFYMICEYVNQTHNKNIVIKNGENTNPTVKYLNVVAYKKEICVKTLKYEQFDTKFLFKN